MDAVALSRWFSGWRGNVLTAFLSITIAILLTWTVGEVYIRLTKPYETPDTLRKKSLEFEATLFADHVFPQMIQVKRGGRYRINERGYRGRLFSVPKQNGVVRIVFLGGSGVFDINAADGRDWPHLAEQRLKAKGYKNVEVINAGTPGLATWDSLGRLYSEIWMFEPDYVLVYEAWNDIKHFDWLNPEKSLLRGFRPQSNVNKKLVANPFLYYTGWPDRLLCRSQLYVWLRWRYWSWRLGELGLEGLIPLRGWNRGLSLQKSYSDSYSEWGPRQYELNLRIIVDAVRNIGATPILLTQARLVTSSNTEEDRKRIKYDYINLSHEAIVHAFTDCDRAVFSAARAEDVPVLDLSRMFTGRSELFADHVHTTPSGSEALAKATADFLESILDKRGH